MRLRATGRSLTQLRLPPCAEGETNAAEVRRFLVERSMASPGRTPWALARPNNIVEAGTRFLCACPTLWACLEKTDREIEYTWLGV